MKRRGLLSLLNESTSGQSRAMMIRPRYSKPVAKYEAGHYEHGQSISLSGSYYDGVTHHKSFQNDGYHTPSIHDRNLSIEQGHPGYLQPDSESFYVEPFEQIHAVDPDQEHSDLADEKKDKAPESVRESEEPRSALIPEVEGTPRNSPGQKKADFVDDEFEADLKNILKGKKRYDANQRKVVAAGDESAHSGKRATIDDARDDAPKKETTKNEHEIFERIAQSMKMAHAYDLGSIALNERFDSFDRQIEEKERAYASNKNVSKPPAKTSEFFQDLKEIQRDEGETKKPGTEEEAQASENKSAVRDPGVSSDVDPADSAHNNQEQTIDSTDKEPTDA